METLKEAAEGYSERHQDVSGALGKYLVSAVFQDGASWQQGRSYSEQEVYELLLKHQSSYRSTVRNTSPLDWSFDVKQWFEQNKKK